MEGPRAGIPFFIMYELVVNRADPLLFQPVGIQDIPLSQVFKDPKPSAGGWASEIRSTTDVGWERNPWTKSCSYGPLPVISTYNPIYRIYNPIYNQL